MSRARILKGADVVCYVNSQLYGQVSSFSWNSSTPKQEIYGLDNPDPYELGVTVTRVHCNMSVYRLVQDGGAQGAGMAATYPDLSREKYFSVQLIDRGSDTIIFEARNCSMESESWNVAARSMVTGNLVFKAIDWSNEVRPLQR